MEVRELDAKYLVRPSAQETEIGCVPVGWSIRRLGELTLPERPISYGIVQTGPSIPNGVPCLRVVDIVDGKVRNDELITTTAEISNAYKRTRLQLNDLVMPLRGKVGECAQIGDDLIGANLTRGVALLAVRQQYSAAFCKQAVSSVQSRSRLNASMNGSALQEVSIAALRAFAVAVPPTRREQELIAQALTDADALIHSLEQLLTKKRLIKQGAMQELLTGKRRLPGFAKQWTSSKISELADPINTINRDGENLPVLTCSKHLGFVDSLGFFKNQVFSEDTSTYKVVKRGQIAYPANHIEEGSIGLQDLYDAALVSPIYVVFEVRSGYHSKFIHRLLKLPEFLPVFSKFTSSSVDRRGSLRWSAFCQIRVRLPEYLEQSSIVEVLEAMEADIGAIETGAV